MIYVFVSSTFKDMQNERDYLHTAIIPVLNAQLKKYGEEAELIDMRWGIDTSAVDEENIFEHIWKACAAEIEKSDFFLLLVGNKYGTIADIYVLTDQDQLKSFTELEFAYAMSIGRINKGHSLACLRELGEDFDHEVILFRKRVEASDAYVLQYAPFENVNWEKDMETVQNTLIDIIQNWCTEQSAYTISARRIRNKARNVPAGMADRFSEEISGKQYVVLEDKYDGANNIVAQGYLRSRISGSHKALYYDCDDDLKSWGELRHKLLQDIGALDLEPLEDNGDISDKLCARLENLFGPSEKLYIMLENADMLEGSGFSKLLSKLPENVYVIITLSNNKEEYSE